MKQTCKFCGEVTRNKLFHDSHRDRCEYNPKNKSCPTCRFWDGVWDGEGVDLKWPCCNCIESREWKIKEVKNDTQPK